MRYRLDEAHYLPGDQFVEAGVIIGDDTPYPFRYPNNDTQNPPRWTAGSPMVPSRSMMPLDEEARVLYRNKWGTDVRVPDPLEKIPVLGTGSQAKAPHPAAPRPGVSIPTPVSPPPANPPSNPATIAQPKPITSQPPAAPKMAEPPKSNIPAPAEGGAKPTEPGPKEDKK